MLGFELRDDLDLDRCVEGELRHADGRAGVQPRLTEDLADELRGAIEDLRLGVEARRRGYEPGNLHDAVYPVQAACLGRRGGEGVEGAETGCQVGLLLRDGVADLAG